MRATAEEAERINNEELQKLLAIEAETKRETEGMTEEEKKIRAEAILHPTTSLPNEEGKARADVLLGRKPPPAYDL